MRADTRTTYGAASYTTCDTGSPEVVEAVLIQVLLGYYRLVVGGADSWFSLDGRLDSQGGIARLFGLVALMRKLRHGGMAGESRCHSREVERGCCARSGSGQMWSVGFQGGAVNNTLSRRGGMKLQNNSGGKRSPDKSRGTVSSGSRIFVGKET